MKVARFRVAELMKARGLRQTDLIEDLHLAPNTVKAYYYNHVRRTDLEVLVKLCEYFQCELSDLLVIEEVPERTS